MDKYISVVQQIVGEATKDKKTVDRFLKVAKAKGTNDISYATMEEVLTKALRDERGDKISFVRSDVGRAWGILEHTLKQCEANGVTKATQEILARAKNNEGAIHSVIQLMLLCEGTHEEPSGYELRKVFYDVLFMPGKPDIEHNNQDLQNAWELVCKHLIDNTETKPEEQPPEENIMSTNQNIPHTTIEYIYGVDIKTMDKSDIMAAIVQVKEEIKDLNDVGVESKYIKDQVTDLEAVVKILVTHLDQ